MILNNPDFLQRVILNMALEQYMDQVVSTNMEKEWIGQNKTWESKEDWVSDYIIEHFNAVKNELIDPSGERFIQKIATEENTFLMRLYSLDIGQSFDFDNFTSVKRMPGGWIYRSHNNGTFIPFNTEFSSEHGILRSEIKMLTEVGKDVPSE